jgi:hypothetical protein
VIATPRRILAAGWLGLAVYAFPGYLSADSILQLHEARTGAYTDWHPPIMAALWRVVEIACTGPFGMFAIQSACFIAGAYLLLRRSLPARGAAIAACALAWWPPIASALAVIWKDSQMVGLLLLGTALLIEARPRAAIALIWLAVAMRYNASIAALPIVVALLPRPAARSRWRQLAIAFALWLAVAASAWLANAALTTERTHPWLQSVALMDLAGTIADAPPLGDDELRVALAGTPLRHDDAIQERARACSDPVWMWDAITGPHALFRHAEDSELDAIGRAWRDVVRAYPLAYLRYRLGVFEHVLSPPRSAYVWFTDVQAIETSRDLVGHDAAPGKLQAPLRDAMLWLGDTWLFQPWIYGVLALLIVPLCRRDRLALVLLASAIISELALFAVAPTPDLRYSLWLVVIAPLVAIRVIAARRGAVA